MNQRLSRRDWMTMSLAGVGAAALANGALAQEKTLFFISLSERSLERSLTEKKLDHLDFALRAKELGFTAVEYASQFFADKAADEKYLAEMNERAAGQGVRQLLIHVEGEGRIGDPDVKTRFQSVRNHHRWIDAARTLGCHSVHVNTASAGTVDDQMKLAADGLAQLCQYASQHNINVLIGNDDKLSARDGWLAGVLKKVDSPNCGALPCFTDVEGQPAYSVVEQLVPFSKSVSATAYEFDEQGNEKRTNFFRMTKLVVDGGYRGYIAVDYRGRQGDEAAGIRAAHELLLRAHKAHVK